MAAALKKAPKAHLSKLMTKPPPPSSTSAAAAANAASDPVARIKSKIRSERDPDRLAAFFQSPAAATSPQFYGDRSIYKLSVKKLARSNRPDLIERILEPQRSDSKFPRSEGFLIRIITLYSDAGMIDHAVKTFNSVPDAGLKHSERTLCALLTAFFKNRKFDKLIESFNSVPESINVLPGITAHNILLQGLCEKGDVDAARKVLDEMPQKKIKPDIVSYNALFNAYLKKGDRAGYEDILKEMKEKGLEADVVTFNCRIAGLCASSRSFEAEELLDVMAAKNVRPNRNTFNMIIEGFCKEGNAKKAMKVFERMKSAKKDDDGTASPNFVTYVALIKSLVENGEFDKGLEVFKECVERKWSPPFGAVRGLVEGLKKESRVKEAKDVVAKMRKVVKGDAMEAWKSIETAISL